MTRWLARCGGLLAAAVVAAGCSGPALPPTCDVTGTVLFDGKPVTGGDITFADEAGVQSRSAYLTIDGTFKIAQAPAGPVLVVVQTESVKHMIDPKTAAMLNKKGAAIVVDDPKVRGNKYVAVPAKYASVTTTDLKMTLKPNKLNEVTVELKK